MLSSAYPVLGRWDAGKLTVSNSTLCWSASFYPQPILNWRRRSTRGLAIDFPTVNVLGFVCYMIYTAVFLYSPLIRQQYAARHPLSPEPSVRFNDLAFAVHAVILSSIVYSMFWSWIWGFNVSRFQHVSGLIAGVFWGCIVAVVAVLLLITSQGKGNSLDPSAWAWIDAVRHLDSLPTSLCQHTFPNIQHLALRHLLCQTSGHSREIRPTGMG